MKKFKKQYFSKLHQQWVDLKVTDSEPQLKSFNYEFRRVRVERK